MEAKVEQAANEIKRLKACINNLISVQALPAICSGDLRRLWSVETEARELRCRI
jgi:hypothetical protein